MHSLPACGECVGCGFESRQGIKSNFMAREDRVFELSGELTDSCDGIMFDVSRHLWRVLGPLKGKKLLVKFGVLRHKRSDAQNRYIWGVMVPTVQAWFKETTGEVKSKDEVYTWFRVGLLGDKPVITEVMGCEVITMSGKRFSQMNTKEFGEAVDMILQLMAEKGCVIPEPRQFNFITEFLTDD